MLVQRPRPTRPLIESRPPKLVRVVDDEPAIRDLFRRVADQAGFDIVVYGRANDLLAELDEPTPGCIVLDLVLPDRTGIDTLQHLADQGCRLPVVIMSGMARVSEAVMALKLGSFDFIEKPFQLESMIATVRGAVDLDAERRREVSNDALLHQRFDDLTPRENQVMERIVRGAANKEVAADLGVSPKTVEVHRANIMRKTQAGSLAQLVRMHIAARSRSSDRRDRPGRGGAAREDGWTWSPVAIVDDGRGSDQYSSVARRRR